MDDAFRAKLELKLTSFREWSFGRMFSDTRLVQYCGVEFIGAQSLLFSEVELRIEGLICEGFYVDWEEHNGKLYLRVWEFDGPEPDWALVFAEESLVDIAELLRLIEQEN